MIGAVGSEEHLAAELVDAFEPPAIVVKLSLRTQAAGLQADVCESGHVHHGPASSSWTVIYGRARPASVFQVVMQVWRKPIPTMAYTHAAWWHKQLQCPRAITRR